MQFRDETVSDLVCQLPKLDVAGSSPVSRSIFNSLQNLTDGLYANNGVTNTALDLESGARFGCPCEEHWLKPLYGHCAVTHTIVMRTSGV